LFQIEEQKIKHHTRRNESSKLSFYNLSDSTENNLKGIPAHLTFHADTQFYSSTNPRISNALPSKIEYERISPYFAFRPQDVIQHTVCQTSQLAKSIIHYAMRRHLKRSFQM
jgi:hypothetical protein